MGASAAREKHQNFNYNSGERLFAIFKENIKDLAFDFIRPGNGELVITFVRIYIYRIGYEYARVPRAK